MDGIGRNIIELIYRDLLGETEEKSENKITNVLGVILKELPFAKDRSDTAFRTCSVRRILFHKRKH